jgi:RNA polymerase sigma factor (TIGR02999 family)
MNPSPEDVTSLLNKLADGDQEARDKLVPLVYKELRRLAARCLQRERENHTLQATALAHEAYLKLTAQRSARWQNRAQFFALAAQGMRRILVDYARASKAEKRGGEAAKVPLEEALVFTAEGRPCWP